MQSFGFNPPTVHIDSLIQGIPHALPYLASAVPLGLANYIFDLENIESAHAAGDEYKTRQIMLANGISSIIGCFCGNPYPVTVYVGHAGWKSLGAGIGYTVATGLSMFLISLFAHGQFVQDVSPRAGRGPSDCGIGGQPVRRDIASRPCAKRKLLFVCA